MRDNSIDVELPPRRGKGLRTNTSTTPGAAVTTTAATKQAAVKAKIASIKTKMATRQATRKARRDTRIAKITAKNPTLGAKLSAMAAKRPGYNPSSAAQNNTGIVPPGMGGSSVPASRPPRPAGIRTPSDTPRPPVVMSGLAGTRRKNPLTKR